MKELTYDQLIRIVNLIKEKRNYNFSDAFELKQKIQNIINE